MINTRAQQHSTFDHLSAWVSMSVRVYCTFCVYECVSVKYSCLYLLFIWTRC